MKTMMRFFTASLMLVIAALSVMQARAAEEIPALTLTLRSLQDTNLRDGDIIGSGRVLYQGGHAGYRVWLEAEKNGTAPERYVLRGKHNAAHRLTVRLTGDNWGPDMSNGSGVIRQTHDEQVSFSVVADGGQQVAADQYAVTANVKALAP